MRAGTGKRSRLPDFLIIGVQRGGTTSLYDYLTRHRRIAKAARKEVHFFDLNYSEGTGWYRSHFPWWAGFRRGVITGEASPYYIFHPAVPQRVEETCPDVKLIVVFRDPVDRAFSHYQLARRRGWESLTFEEAIRTEHERLEGEATKLLDPSYQSFEYQNLSYVARGLYADQVENWTRYFSLERFLFLRSEDLYEDPGSVLGSTLAFLGLDPIDLESYPQRNRGSYEERVPDDSRAYLIELYHPHNLRLYEMIGRDMGWDG